MGGKDKIRKNIGHARHRDKSKYDKKVKGNMRDHFH